MLKWPTVEKEAFAFREVCDRYAYILKRPDGFTAFTDHRNLIYLFNNARRQRMDGNRRLSAWSAGLCLCEVIVMS
jgi:hypothetical protein